MFFKSVWILYLALILAVIETTLGSLLTDTINLTLSKASMYFFLLAFLAGLLESKENDGVE